MAIIKNPILARIQSLIGSPGAGTPTVLDDDSVSLTLPIVPAISRRGLAGLSTGMFVGMFECSHVASGELEAGPLDPYAVVSTNIVLAGGWPTPVPDGFDVWVLSACGEFSGGTASAFTESALTIEEPNVHRAWSINQAGASVSGAIVRTVAWWDNIQAALGLVGPLQNTISGQTIMQIGERMRRGSLLSYHSEATGTVETRAQVLMGLFPAGLGQDGVT